jgi:hypothetical protein
MTVTDRTQHRSRPGPPGPAEPAGSLSSHHRATVDASPSRPPLARSTPPAAGGGTAMPEAGPPRPRWGPEGPRSGPRGRGHQPPRHPTAKQRRRRRLVIRSCATRRGASPLEPPQPEHATADQESPAPPSQTRGSRQGRRRRHRAGFARRPALAAAEGEEEGGRELRARVWSPRRRPQGTERDETNRLGYLTSDHNCTSGWQR